MIQYIFTIGINSHVAWFENDEQASKFAEFIKADWERDTIIYKIDNGDNKFCMFEVEIGDPKNFNSIRNLKIKNIKIWEI
jgi:hypothetical protein